MKIDYAITGHKLRSPLATIKSLLFLAERAKNSNERNKKLKKIDQEINLLNSRITSFLDLQRLKDNQVEFLYSYFDIGKSLEKQIRLFRGKITGEIEHRNVVADKENLEKALKVIFEKNLIDSKTGKFFINTKTVKKFFLIRFKYKFKPNDSLDFKDGDYSVWVATRIIVLHGGKVEVLEKKETRTVYIYLPLKATKLKA